MSFQIKRYICEPLMTNAYVVYDGEKREAIVVDPAPGSFEKIVLFVKKENLTLKYIVLTHSHWDHIADCHALQEHFSLPIYVHHEDRENVEVPGSDSLQQIVPVKAARVDHELKDGDVLRVGKYTAKVIHTPGHSPGGICLYFQDQGILFSGDTLFKGAYGSLDLPTAQENRMKTSLHRLSQLEESTVVYCGHGVTTTIANEPWLKNF